MQAGHGGLYGTNKAKYREFGWGAGGQYIDVAKLVSTYRKRVNPKVKVFLVITSYSIHYTKLYDSPSGPMRASTSGAGMPTLPLRAPPIGVQ